MRLPREWAGPDGGWATGGTGRSSWVLAVVGRETRASQAGRGVWLFSNEYTSLHKIIAFE